jgi:hypothetical protein
MPEGVILVIVRFPDALSAAKTRPAKEPMLHSKTNPKKTLHGQMDCKLRQEFLEPTRRNIGPSMQKGM